MGFTAKTPEGNLETLTQPLEGLSISRAYKKSRICVLNRRDHLTQLVSMLQPPFSPRVSRR